MSDRSIADVVSALLPRASGASIRRLGTDAVREDFRRHDRLSRDDAPRRLLLVLDGYLGSWRSDAEGHEQLVALTGPGEFASLLALTECTPVPDVRAVSSGSAATWPARSVLELAEADPGLGLSLLEQTLHASSRLLTRLEHVSFDPVQRRLARLLWQRREVLFDSRRPLLSRVQLANLAGATREMVDRVLREFEQEGIVARVGSTGLVLVDSHRLEALAGADEDERLCS